MTDEATNVEPQSATPAPARTEGFLEKLVDRVNKRLPANIRYDPSGNWSYDWCRYRRREHCYYPKELNEAATQEAGYQVWVPYDRGFCSLAKWADQMKCPMSFAGPNSGEEIALIDATVPYEEGGQHGGVPVHLAP